MRINKRPTITHYLDENPLFEKVLRYYSLFNILKNKHNSHTVILLHICRYGK